MNLLILARKELRHYFNSPLAYVVIIAFLLINGWFLGNSLFRENVASLRSFFNTVTLILVFFVPAFAMRLLAEEKRQGTLELLVTQPLTDLEIVLGKFLGGLLFYAVVLGSTLIYPIAIAWLGPLDPGPVIGGYLGLYLMGAGLIAIGLFASALTTNQIVAFIMSFFLGFVLFLLGKVTQFVPTFLSGIINYLGFDSHFNSISKGIIDSRDVLYYLSLIAIMLFLTLQTLLNRKK